MQPSLIVPPSLVIPGRDLSVEMIDAVRVLTNASDAADALVKRSLELYVRRLVLALFVYKSLFPFCREHYPQGGSKLFCRRAPPRGSVLSTAVVGNGALFRNI